MIPRLIDEAIQHEGRKIVEIKIKDNFVMVKGETGKHEPIIETPIALTSPVLKDIYIALKNKNWGDTFENKEKVIQAIQKYLNKNTNENIVKPLPFLSSKEILETPKEKNFIIEGLLQKDTLTQLYSPPAEFKSLVSLYLAVCVSNGKPFLDLKTKKSNVLYLDKENNRQMLRERLQLIHKGLGLRRKKFPLTFLLREGMLDDEHFVETLAEYVEENNIQLIIFDTLIRFNSGEENSAKDMNRLYKSFLKLQEATGCAIWFLHHTNKSGEYRGSIDLKGQVDCQYKLKRTKDTELVTMINEKNRSGEIDPINISIIFEEEKILFTRAEELAESVANERRNVFQDARSFVLTFARENEEFRYGDIKTELAFHNNDHQSCAISETMMKRALKWLQKEKIIEKVEHGLYKYVDNQEKHDVNNWIVDFGTKKSDEKAPVPDDKNKETQ